MAKRRMVKYMLKNALRNSLSAATRSGIDPFDALIVGCYESRKLRYVSRVKAGFNRPLRWELYKLLAVFETSRCRFTNLPEARSYRWGYELTKEEMKDCRWLRPKLVA